MVEVRQIIEVAFNRGSGVAPDMVRRVHAYYDLDGRLLAENDPLRPQFDPAYPTQDMTVEDFNKP